MGKKKPKVEVNEYYMSQHIGVCHGADAITHITVGEKLAWTGRAASNSTISIAKRELFGGNKKEGGVAGLVHVLLGRSDQVLADPLAARLGRGTGANCPGFRGLTSLFFTGSKGDTLPGSLDAITALVKKITAGGAARSGFYWTANGPYLRDVWIGVERAPKGLAPGYSMIQRGGVKSAPGAIYFLLDRSGSLSGGEFTTIKNAVKASLDEIKVFIEKTGERVDIGVRFYSAASTARELTNATPADIDELKTWITAQTQVNGGNVYAAMGFVRAWFDATATVKFDKRSIVLVTDSNTEDDMPAAAAGPAADFLNRDTSPYSVIEGNPVDMFAINYNTDTTIWTKLLDNTPEDGIPSITSSDQEGLINAVRRALPNKEYDANPAHMIYECLTNRDWGMGAPSTIVDVAAFEAAGVTLYNESLGLSMIWTRQTTIENFITEIIDHIQATVFVNPRTGLITIKLIRDDFDVATLRTLTPDNADLNNFQRKAWGEVINEIIVTWTNPETEQDETVTMQDNGSIAAQGTIVSDNRNYYGVRSSALAMRLAERDLRASSAPIATCDVEVDRSAWDLLPGEVVKLTWPEHSLNQMVMRVGSVDYGKPGDATIKATLMEDVFSFAKADYSYEPPTTSWEGGDEEPVTMAHSKIITVPSFLAANYNTSGATFDYPEVLAGILAASSVAQNYDLYGPTVEMDGTTVQEVQATNDPAGWGTLAIPLVAASESTSVTFSNLTDSGVVPGPNVFVFIGGSADGDAGTEIALITAYDSTTGAYTLARGVLDTVPRDWAAGTEVWFIALTSDISDLDIKSDGEAVTYKLLTRTFSGVLAPEEAPNLTGTLSGRPYYPLRPADVKVNGVGFGQVDCDGVNPIPVTWANRNRLTEDSQIVRWNEATAAPEVGQTTTVEVIAGEDGTVLATHSGLSGTSYNLDPADFGSKSWGYIRVSSECDGHASLQAHQILTIVKKGYGYRYGYNYGGA